MYAILAVKYTAENYNTISALINRDHSTISYSKKTVKEIPFFNSIYHQVNRMFLISDENKTELLIQAATHNRYKRRNYIKK